MRVRTIRISEGYLRMIADSLEIALKYGDPRAGLSANEAVTNIVTALRKSVDEACDEQHRRPHGW
jgi:hypothetical protein